MPLRLALARRSTLPIGFLAALAWCSSSVESQELPLVRDYPGSGQYECPAPPRIAEPPDEVDLRRAAQLASDANQAMALGDFERSQELLAQATDLDPTSADYAYRHARTLEDLGDADNALVEYCRALARGVEDLGVLDTRDRIDALYETVRERIPEAARNAFVTGLEQADDAAWPEAVEAFTSAIDAAPEWGAPVYNRGVIYEEMGLLARSLEDYRRYVELAPTDVDPILVLVSERIGQLEGAASVVTPSPAGALALGVIPGMGHYYSGRPIVGTLTLVGAVGAIAAGLMVQDITTLCVADVPPGGTCPSNLVVGEVTERPYLSYGIGAAAAITLVGAVDALLKARSRRARSEAIAGALEGGDDPSVSLGFPTVERDGSTVRLSLVRLRFD